MQISVSVSTTVDPTKCVEITPTEGRDHAVLEVLRGTGLVDERPGGAVAIVRPGALEGHGDAELVARARQLVDALDWLIDQNLAESLAKTEVVQAGDLVRHEVISDPLFGEEYEIAPRRGFTPARQ